MKVSRSSNKWGSLYILLAFGMVVLFWEESLKIESTQHKILASVIVLLLGFLIVHWIKHHQENFIDHTANKKYILYYPTNRQKNDNSEEKK